MSRSEVFKSIELQPFLSVVREKNKLTIVDPSFISEKLVKTINVVREMEKWGRKSNPANPEYYIALTDGAHPETGELLPSTNNEIARVIGYRYQEYLPEEMLVKSRVERLIGHNHIAADKIMGDKYKSFGGERYSTVGKKRTFSWVPPSPSNAINLGATNSSYSQLLQTKNLIILDVVAYDVKATLLFRLPEKYVTNNKVAKPVISLSKKGNIRYHFSVAYKRLFPEISSKYVVGVDVGKRCPFTAVLLDVRTGLIVKELLPSSRVMKLARRIKITETQIRNLQRKIRKNPLATLHLQREVEMERVGLSRTKREMAILVGQEVSGFAFENDNAIIAVEDLSWISNTMENGRWNRGEQIKWIQHYANHQGLLCYKVGSYNTSQECYRCEKKGYNDSNRVFHCKSVNCQAIDRDINASANIAKKVIDRAVKSSRTRNKTRKRRGITAPVQRVIPVRQENFKKGRPTPKRRKKKVVKRDIEPVIKLHFGSCSKGRVGNSTTKRKSTERQLQQPEYKLILDQCIQHCSRN